MTGISVPQQLAELTQRVNQLTQRLDDLGQRLDEPLSRVTNDNFRSVSERLERLEDLPVRPARGLCPVGRAVHLNF